MQEDQDQRLPDPSPPTAPPTPPEQFGGVLAPLAWLDGMIAKIEAFVLAAGTLMMATVSVANVLGRFLFGQSIFFAEELNQFLIILITFVGLGYAARMGRHIRMSAFYDALGDGGRKAMMVLICVVTAGFMFTLAYYSYEYVVSQAQTGRIYPSLRVPIWWTLLWMPAGFAITGIQYILTAIANLTREDVYLSASVVDSYDEHDDEISGV
ncbi:TRAP transporter small permease [Paracoccaceae bacterium GXU_MW_L88]